MWKSLNHPDLSSDIAEVEKSHIEAKSREKKRMANAYAREQRRNMKFNHDKKGDSERQMEK